MKNNRIRESSGFTLLELVLAMGMMTMFTSLAVLNLKDFTDTLVNGSSEVNSFLKQVRAKAVETTRSYHIKASSSTKLYTTYANACSTTTQTSDPLMVLNMPRGTSIVDTNLDICFTTRGLSNSSTTIVVRDSAGATKSVQLVLGGATRVL